jgi:hypothetical protein
MTTPVFDARRCTRTGSVAGGGGGPAGRLPRSLATCSSVSGFGRVRSNSRVFRSKNISAAGSIPIPTYRPARISAAGTDCPARATQPLRVMPTSTSTATAPNA